MNGRKETVESNDIERRCVSDIRPAPENDQVYRPIELEDPEILALAQSIRTNGLIEPIVISEDGYIISGHRRWNACLLLSFTGEQLNEFGQNIPVRVQCGVKRGDPEFLRLLREANRQRVKGLDEVFREAVIDANPEDAYERVLAYRKEKSDKSDFGNGFIISGKKIRRAISPAKQPMLEAALRVLEERREFLPLSVRAIHYASSTIRRFEMHTDRTAFIRMTARPTKILQPVNPGPAWGLIEWEMIVDETRPVSLWNVHYSPAAFIGKELENFLQGYWRDLQRSQPNHIEIIGEKLTIKTLVKRVASTYTIPVTIGRGFCSIQPRHDIAVRFQKSGKDRLVLLLLSDHDPDGVEISQSFARSMRDDFGIENLDPIKVALNEDQVRELDLPPSLEAKSKSSNYGKFADQHGRFAYELEAVEPEKLQEILTEAIDDVLDLDLFNQELEREKQDTFEIDRKRRQILAIAGHMED
jgi:hypothetical protein